MILEEILEKKRAEIAGLRTRLDRLGERAAVAPEPRGLRAALKARDTVAVLAEFKRRSPSTGPLAPGARPAEVARGYGEGGADAISVLTDGPYFGGSLEDVGEVRSAVDLPVLRKDFILDPVQLLEARAAGADAVLLIVRALGGEALEALLGEAGRLGLDCLVEAHTEEELGRAIAAGAELIGVNARDLESFAVDLALCEAMLGAIPPDRIAVAESGIRGRPDVERMAAAGADAVLVGGWLMQSGPEAVRELTGVPRRDRPRGTAPRVAGLSRPEGP